MSDFQFNEEKHEYTLGGIVIPGVTQVIQDAGLINFDGVNKELLDYKADIGRKVHSATELYDSGILDEESLHPILKGYFDSWVKFRKDFKFEPVKIEAQLFHPIYRFAGRIDRIGMIDKDETLVEIKSGGKQKVHEIQTAGYSLLWCQDKKKIKRRIAVYLSEEGYKIEEHKNPSDKNIFIACLSIYNYKKGLK